MRKGKFKAFLIKALRFITNPRLLLCIAVAWIVTNGWSYVFFGLGTYFEIGWMAAVGGAYLTFLWLPISPEKLLTIVIAMALLRWWFPNDQKTLAVLKTAHANAKEKWRKSKEKRAEKRRKRQQSPKKSGDSP